MTIVFSVDNQHVEECGIAPSWTTAAREAAEVRAYFENSYGEQWVASVTPSRFLLTGGDIDWKTVRVDAPDYRKLAAHCADPSVTSFEGTGLNREERLWLTVAQGRIPSSRTASTDCYRSGRYRTTPSHSSSLLAWARSARSATTTPISVSGKTSMTPGIG